MIAAVVLPLVAFAGLNAAETRPANRPAPLSAILLKQRIIEAQRRLWAWEVEYESARDDSPDNPASGYVHRLVAAKAPDRFFHWSAHGTSRLNWRDDPGQQRLTIKANRLFFEKPLDRFFIEQPFGAAEPLPGSAPGELWLIASGWWPLAGRPSPKVADGLPAALSAVAQSAKYGCKAHLELAGDTWCHVLECPGHDQLWFDADKGCALLAREITYAAAGRVHRVEFTDLRELKQGIWVPFRLRNVHYERAPDGIVGKTIIDAPLTVLRLQLNEAVDDALFQFNHPPGSLGKIGNGAIQQAAPGGEDYLDQTEEWIRRYVPADRYRGLEGRPIDWLGSILGALLGSVVVAALLWGRFRASRRGG